MDGDGIAQGGAGTADLRKPVEWEHEQDGDKEEKNIEGRVI
jgi:hypothetical protein